MCLPYLLNQLLVFPLLSLLSPPADPVVLPWPVLIGHRHPEGHEAHEHQYQHQLQAERYPWVSAHKVEGKGVCRVALAVEATDPRVSCLRVRATQVVEGREGVRVSEQGLLVGRSRVMVQGRKQAVEVL